MDMLKVLPSDSKLWEQVWRLYTESFPEWERRKISSHRRAVEDADFHTYIAVDNGNMLALLFYWESGDMIFIEHVAVNPQMRGKNVGSELLRQFMDNNPDKTIILEIDPPEDEVSQRRLVFYDRLGFKRNSGDFDYTHPSYVRGGKVHRLELLSYPGPISVQKFGEFKKYMSEKVLKYID